MRPALAVGDWVRCEREAPAKGTWHRYDGRTGRIVRWNEIGGEFGVAFTAYGSEPPTWFLPSELVRIDKPENAPAIRTSAEHGVVPQGRTRPISATNGGAVA